MKSLANFALYARLTRMQVAALGVAAATFALCFALGQEPTPRFEVVSIKPAKGLEFPGYTFVGGPGTVAPGQLTCRNIPLRPILLRAFNLRPYELVGPPAIDSDKFDIVAKIPPGTTKEQFETMLQSMLVERFALAIHRETENLPIYEMVVAKGGPKLSEPEKSSAGTPPQGSPEQGPGNRAPAVRMAQDKDWLPLFPPGTRAIGVLPAKGGMRISARMETIADLLTMLQAQIGRPVVDKTGLTGVYDFALFYLPEGWHPPSPGAAPAAPAPEQPWITNDAPAPAPTLFEALEKQLGLKLVAKRGPIQVLVIDHVDKSPIPN